MKHQNKLTTAALTSLVAISALLTSCNEKNDSEMFVDPVNLAVTSFSLKSNIGAQELDTVFFSIDLNRGLIFNADSLLKGTDISKVVASIKFNSKVSEAVIEMTGGSTRTGEIDYKKNPTDSIDFTGDVTLRVKADDNSIAKSYRIKVNVHNIDTDTLYWSESAVRKLPSRLAKPLKQKTVTQGDDIISMIRENDGTYTIATTDSPSEDDWVTDCVTFPFNPEISSLASTGNALWILSEDGGLYQSADKGGSWTLADNNWATLIGSYGDTVTGIKRQDGAMVFTQYPKLGISEERIPDDFPTEGISNFVTLANKWTLSPVAFFTGGITSAGKLSDCTWAFDGTNWIKLSSGGIPGLAGASVIPYYNYRPSALSNTMLKYSVWMLIGGRMGDGNFNRTVYISYDNGVNWTKGAESLQLPDHIPAMMGCDNIVSDTEMSANLSDAWKVTKKTATRSDYEIDGDVIRWGCPYIYLFGGYAPDGTLYDTVWRGVLSRLTFTPII